MRAETREKVRANVRVRPEMEMWIRARVTVITEGESKSEEAGKREHKSDSEVAEESEGEQ